jgi:hypothetical protein
MFGGHLFMFGGQLLMFGGQLFMFGRQLFMLDQGSGGEASLEWVGRQCLG